MDIWNETALPQILRLTKIDPEYQALLQQCRRMEERYIEFLSMIPEKQQEELETYIGMCEELDYRFAQLAYQCGVGATHLNKLNK